MIFILAFFTLAMSAEKPAAAYPRKTKTLFLPRWLTGWCTRRHHRVIENCINNERCIVAPFETYMMNPFTESEVPTIFGKRKPFKGKNPEVGQQFEIDPPSVQVLTQDDVDGDINIQIIVGVLDYTDNLCNLVLMNHLNLDDIVSQIVNQHVQEMFKNMPAKDLLDGFKLQRALDKADFMSKINRDSKLQDVSLKVYKINLEREVNGKIGINLNPEWVSRHKQEVQEAQEAELKKQQHERQVQEQKLLTQQELNRIEQEKQQMKAQSALAMEKKNLATMEKLADAENALRLAEADRKSRVLAMKHELLEAKNKAEVQQETHEDQILKNILGVEHTDKLVGIIKARVSPDLTRVRVNGPAQSTALHLDAEQ